MKHHRLLFWSVLFLAGGTGCATIPEFSPPRLPKGTLAPEEHYYVRALCQVVDALHRVDTWDTVTAEEKYLKRLVRMAPGEGGVYWRYARFHIWMWEWEKDRQKKRQWAERALEMASKAIHLASSEAASHYYYALALGVYLDSHKSAALKGLPKLIHHAQKAAELDETFDHAGPHRLLGRVFLEAPEHLGGDLDAAREHLERAVELFPQCPENLYALAQVYLEDEETARAKELLVRVGREQFPTSPRILYYMRQKALEELRRLEPSEPRHTLALAKLHLRLGNTKYAKKLLQSLLESSFSNAERQKVQREARTLYSRLKKSFEPKQP